MMLAAHEDLLLEAEQTRREITAAVRCDRIQEARRRLAGGWYDREDVLDLVIEGIIHDAQYR